jgi:zinc transporter 9
MCKRSFYPEAVFIELEPDSKDTENHAIANMTTQAQRVSEREAMSRALAHLGRVKAIQRDPNTPIF